MKKFEYQIVTSGNLHDNREVEDLERRLNEFGFEGWEATKMIQLGAGVNIFMRREILNEPEGDDQRINNAGWPC